jgi:hypothetical protein
METIHQLTTDMVLDQHLQSFINNDIEALMRDYTDESELWKADGQLKGKEAIAAFYSYIFSILPRESTEMHPVQRIVQGSKAYIVWSAESAFISIPLGTDSFEISDGKIIWQSVAGHIVPKS